MLDEQPQPTPEQIAQRLRLMDVRLNQQHPGYLDMLEQLRQPSPYHPIAEQWHTNRRGPDNEPR